MAEYIRLIDQIEPSDEAVASQFTVETSDNEMADLCIWDNTTTKELDWELGAWYEITDAQRKEFGETIELQVVAETKIELVRSEKKLSQLEHTEDPYSSRSDRNLDTEPNYTIAETIKWLQNESRYSEQIEHIEQVPSQDPSNKNIEILPTVQNALESFGIHALFYHQYYALDAARGGSNLVLASDTASGKSIPYQIHTIETALKNNSTTLYIAPQRSLINDQAETFRQLIDEMDLTHSLEAAIYHGGIPGWKKKLIRKSQPNIILMTPEQVQSSLLQWHDKIWAWFFERLDTIIIDEIHEFRGIFGSHISHICRRMNRVASHYDSDPQYFCCSATIGNPNQHASNITGKPTDSFVIIDQDSSGKGNRHWLLYNPPYSIASSTTPPSPDYPDNWGTIRQEVKARDNYTCTNCGIRGGRISPVTFHIDHIIPVGRGGSHKKTNLRTLCTSCHNERPGHSISTKRPSSPKTAQEVKQERERLSNQTLALRLFTELVSRGHQTVVFENRRQGTERYAEVATSKIHKFSDQDITGRIAPYHSHLPNDTRTEIENGLQSGEIRGVWSTSALEVGVDIGGLDAVILSGHPGTTMELFQRAGRAGRGLDDCLVLFIASGNPLDQYCIANPDRIFDQAPGNAATNVHNPEILDNHILCSAEELPITESDQRYPNAEHEELIASLEQQEQLILEQNKNRHVWRCNVREPHQSINLRGMSDWKFNLMIESSSVEIDTTLSLREALRDCHPGAIYMLNGKKYQVSQFDEKSQKIYLCEHNGPEFSNAYPEESISLDNIIEERHPESLQNVTVGLAEVTYKSNVYEYLFKKHHDDENPEKRYINQDLPTFKLDTEAFYLTVPDVVRQRVSNMTNVDHPFLAGLHGIEHLLMSLFPLEVLCEQQDIGGLSLKYYSGTDRGTIFLYDNIPGGVGLSRTAFNEAETLLGRAYDLVVECECEHGCPRCIYSSQCQVGNRALHKDLTILILQWLSLS